MCFGVTLLSFLFIKDPRKNFAYERIKCHKANCVEDLRFGDDHVSLILRLISHSPRYVSHIFFAFCEDRLAETGREPGNAIFRYLRREKERGEREGQPVPYFRSTSHVNAVISQIANFAVTQR